MAALSIEAELAAFQAGIEGWADATLQPYVDRLLRQETDGWRPAESKELNDAIWGTVALSPLEVLVLDSPILQRLRRIRQLGVVHLVYPSAVHTRFEHSIGAVQQLARVVDAINRSSSPAVVIDDRWSRALRLAALCHDVGHGAMSHVSQNALEVFPQVEALGIQFARTHHVQPATLSEIAAFYILNAASFRAMLEVATRLTLENLPDGVADALPAAVIGKTISEEVPLLHEMISGPFDADKLDYMTRDARMTGVPLVTDVPRLVQKVRAVQLPVGRLPEEVQRQIHVGSGVHWLTGIALSGARTLDELLIGRALLFDKLYRHQKVRAVEAMVAGIYRQLGDLVGDYEVPLLPYALDDEEITALDSDGISKVIGRTLGQEDEAPASIALDLARRLRVRELFVRAYAFAQAMPMDPYRADRSHANGLRRLIALGNDSIEREDLAARIAAECQRVLASVGKEELLSPPQAVDLRPYVVVDPPKGLTGTSKIASAYLLGGDGKCIKFAEDTAEAPSWTSAYPATRDVGYVFTTPELKEFVFIATERVLREEYGIRTSESMYDYSKQSADKVRELKLALTQVGYYDGTAFDLRPVPDRLRRADMKPRLGRVEEALGGYQGPIRDEDIREEKKLRLANPERMSNWLAQFAEDDLIDAGLRMLENLELIGRQDLTRGLSTFLEGNGEFHGGTLAPLGTPKDSSSILTYEALDAGAAYGMRVASLGEALSIDRPVVLVDDFVGRGSQAISIIENWLGVEPTVNLREDRGSALDGEAQELLRRRRLALVFSAGTVTGRQAVEARVTELGLNAVLAVMRTELPSALDIGIYEAPEQGERFLERCREIGTQLLLDADAGHDAEWAAERALGYGNDGYLIVFPYNTPTQALTVLWSGGEYDGVQWDPLFPRRRKR